MGIDYLLKDGLLIDGIGKLAKVTREAVGHHHSATGLFQ